MEIQIGAGERAAAVSFDERRKVGEWNPGFSPALMRQRRRKVTGGRQGRLAGNRPKWIKCFWAEERREAH